MQDVSLIETVGEGASASDAADSFSATASSTSTTSSSSSPRVVLELDDSELALSKQDIEFGIMLVQTLLLGYVTWKEVTD
jgi:hypothetical protein